MKTEIRLKHPAQSVENLSGSALHRRVLRYRNYCFRSLSAVVLLQLFVMVLYRCSPVMQPVGDNGTPTSTEVVGRVVAPDNRAVGGVQVLLFDTLDKGTNSFIDTIAGTTDKNGNFKLLVDSSGTYLLTVKDSVGRSYMDEVDIPDQNNRSLSLGELKVDTMGSLGGFIYDNTNFKANITVILYKKDMPFMYLWRRGEFTIDSLAPGEVRIQIGGWIDDYSRVNKWIIFFDSTVQVHPGRKSVIDTVFINETTLRKAEERSMETFGMIRPGYERDTVGSRKTSASLWCTEAGYAAAFPAVSVPAISECGIEINKSIHLFRSDKPAGAAVNRFDKSDSYAVTDDDAGYCLCASGSAYYSLILEET